MGYSIGGFGKLKKKKKRFISAYLLINGKPYFREKILILINVGKRYFKESLVTGIKY